MTDYSQCDRGQTWVNDQGNNSKCHQDEPRNVRQEEQIMGLGSMLLACSRLMKLRNDFIKYYKGKEQLEKAYLTRIVKGEPSKQLGPTRPF